MLSLCSSAPSSTYEMISISRWLCVPNPIPGATRSSLITRNAPKPHLLGIVIIGERKRVIRVEPAMIGMTAIGRFADGQHQLLSLFRAQLDSPAKVLFDLLVRGRGELMSNPRASDIACAFIKI